MKHMPFLLLLGLFSALPAAAAPAPDPVRLAALEVRVGEFSTALKLLESYEGKTGQDVQHRLVEARALSVWGVTAKPCNVGCGDGIGPSLSLIVASFQIAVLGDDDDFENRQTTGPDRYVTTSLRSPTASRRRSNCYRPSLPLEFANQKMVKHRDRSIRARALALLADEGDLTLMAQLLVKYPDSEEAVAGRTG